MIECNMGRGGIREKTFHIVSAHGAAYLYAIMVKSRKKIIEKLGTISEKCMAYYRSLRSLSVNGYS
jgi:hypothetical protein